MSEQNVDVAIVSAETPDTPPHDRGCRWCQADPGEWCEYDCGGPSPALHPDYRLTDEDTDDAACPCTCATCHAHEDGPACAHCHPQYAPAPTTADQR